MRRARKPVLGKGKPVLGKILRFPRLFRKRPQLPPLQPVQIGGKVRLNTQKQVELERLCNELLRRRELVMSGKLQLLGLAEIRKRLGSRWRNLCDFIHDTVEDAIRIYIGQSDLYIRYRDETYLIIFATAEAEEAQTITSMIATEIRQRLFALDEQQLRGIEIHSAVKMLLTDRIAESGLSDFLDLYASDTEEFPELVFCDPLAEEGRDDIPAPLPDMASVEVVAEDYRPDNALEAADVPVEIACGYHPLWDVQRNALTTYLCEAVDDATGKNLFNAYNNQKDIRASHLLALDMDILRRAMQELADMEREGRKALVTCPVQHHTLYRFESYERYKELLQEIPPQHYPFLIFHVIDTREDLPLKDTYWFARPLRQYCRHVFAEVPLRYDINFNYLYNTGVDVVGARLEQNSGPEIETIKLINSFCVRAKSLRIPFTFILGVNRLSLATSSVCAGFDFIGGEAIQPKLEKPGIVHKYTYSDLIKELKTA